METLPDDLECGDDGNDDVDAQTDDPFRGPADEPVDDPDDEWADEQASTIDLERSDVEEANEEKSPTESPTGITVDWERDDDEGIAGNKNARPSASRGKAKGRYCKAAAMVLVVCGIAIALLSITLGLGLEWWNGRLFPPEEDLCTLCGENGLDLFAIDEATPLPTRQPSEPDPVHIFSYSHRAR